MFFFIVSILFVEPIPKTAYEGSIALTVSKPEPGLLILTPTGKELKRVSLNEVKGTPFTVRLGRNRTCALIVTIETIDESKSKYTYRGYFIDLGGEKKPRLLVEKPNPWNWVINRDATLVFGSESDPKAITKESEVHPQLHWQLDLKSGVFQGIKLPSNHTIIDIAHDDNSILTAHWPGKTYAEDVRAGIFSIKGWKPMYLSTEKINPHVLSPDGKYLLALERVRKKRRGPGVEYPMTIHNIATREQKPLADPEEILLGSLVAHHSFGTNNRIVVISDSNDNLGGIKQRIYVIAIDGSANQCIYEAKAGEEIRDCDWR